MHELGTPQLLTETETFVKFAQVLLKAQVLIRYDQDLKAYLLLLRG
jgi:hypothetical protein